MGSTLRIKLARARKAEALRQAGKAVPKQYSQQDRWYQEWKGRQSAKRLRSETRLVATKAEEIRQGPSRAIKRGGSRRGESQAQRISRLQREKRTAQREQQQAQFLTPEAQQKEFGRVTVAPKRLSPTQLKRARSLTEEAQKKEYGRVVYEQQKVEIPQTPIGGQFAQQYVEEQIQQAPQEEVIETPQQQPTNFFRSPIKFLREKGQKEREFIFGSLEKIEKIKAKPKPSPQDLEELKGIQKEGLGIAKERTKFVYGAMGVGLAPIVAPKIASISYIGKPLAGATIGASAKATGVTKQAAKVLGETATRLEDYSKTITGKGVGKTTKRVATGAGTEVLRFGQFAAEKPVLVGTLAAVVPSAPSAIGGGIGTGLTKVGVPKVSAAVAGQVARKGTGLAIKGFFVGGAVKTYTQKRAEGLSPGFAAGSAAVWFAPLAVEYVGTKLALKSQFKSVVPKQKIKLAKTVKPVKPGKLNIQKVYGLEQIERAKAVGKGLKKNYWSELLVLEKPKLVVGGSAAQSTQLRMTRKLGDIDTYAGLPGLRAKQFAAGLKKAGVKGVISGVKKMGTVEEKGFVFIQTSKAFKTKGFATTMAGGKPAYAPLSFHTKSYMKLFPYKYSKPKTPEGYKVIGIREQAFRKLEGIYKMGRAKDIPDFQKIVGKKTRFRLTGLEEAEEAAFAFYPKAKQPKYPSYPIRGYPTSYPVKYPTSYPVKYPTSYPIKYPTSYPVKYPTSYPIKYPKSYPVKYPAKYAPSYPPAYYPAKVTSYPPAYPGYYQPYKIAEEPTSTIPYIDFDLNFEPTKGKRKKKKVKKGKAYYRPSLYGIELFKTKGITITKAPSLTTGVGIRKVTRLKL